MTLTLHGDSFTVHEAGPGFFHVDVSRDVAAGEGVFRLYVGDAVQEFVVEMPEGLRRGVDRHPVAGFLPVKAAAPVAVG